MLWGFRKQPGWKGNSTRSKRSGNARQKKKAFWLKKTSGDISKSEGCFWQQYLDFRFDISGKQADKAISRIIEGYDQLLIPKPIIDEVLGVLARKFPRDPEELARVAILLSDLSETVRPRRRIRMLKGGTENVLLPGMRDLPSPMYYSDNFAWRQHERTSRGQRRKAERVW
jgi:hypothetical protein